METELGQIHGRAEDIDTLFLEVQAALAYASMAPDRLSNLIARIPNCPVAVIAAEGNTTKY